MTPAYIAGFRKEAEAHGIDPDALVKEAQKYRTEGWAPKSIAEIGPGYFPVGGIPSKYHPDGLLSSKPYDYTGIIDNIDATLKEHGGNVPTSGVFADRKKQEWLRAHLDTLKEMSGRLKEEKNNLPLRQRIFFNGIGEDGRKLRQTTGRLYTEGMNSRTNTTQTASQNNR